MIVRCPTCGLIRITTMRKTCPTCSSQLARATVEELQEVGSQAMLRSRASRSLLENSTNDDKHRRLALFMWSVEGRRMSPEDTKQILGE